MTLIRHGILVLFMLVANLSFGQSDTCRNKLVLKGRIVAPYADSSFFDQRIQLEVTNSNTLDSIFFTTLKVGDYYSYVVSDTGAYNTRVTSSPSYLLYSDNLIVKEEHLCIPDTVQLLDIDVYGIRCYFPK